METQADITASPKRKSLARSIAWSVLEPCLKEGLTNAARHGAPGKVLVTLDVGPRIVRLCVHNPAGGGAGSGRGVVAAEAPGLGLRSLRQRARAVGGSLTTDATNGFRLICVLPLSGAEAP